MARDRLFKKVISRNPPKVLVGEDVLVTAAQRARGWIGGKDTADNANATYPDPTPIRPKIRDPKTGKEIDEPDYAKTHDWDEKKKKWVPKKGKEPVYDLEAEKARRAERGLPERISIRKEPLPEWTDPTYVGKPAKTPDIPFPSRDKPKPVNPLKGRRRTLHRQQYGKELSGRLSEGLKTGKFDTVGAEDVARRQRLALTDDQSTLFLKKELAKTIEDNIAADKDYYKKADNLDELENIFAVGEQIDPWSGNMTEANIERFINKIETRKPSKQEIYEEGKARLARQHASRFGPAAWDR